MEVTERLKPSFEIENCFEGIIAGVDEVGYGAWAGPVVSAAVILSKTCSPDLLNLLNDSKKISPPQREKIYNYLMKSTDVWISVGQASVEEIDSLNIRQASLLSMTRAIQHLNQPLMTVIVDGLAIPKCEYRCYAYVKGDQRSYSIAAASIVAKVTRDRFMKEISQQHPHFGWERNVGYGTKIHSEALKKHGPTPWHRKSYQPIAELLSKQPL